MLKTQGLDFVATGYSAFKHHAEFEIAMLQAEYAAQPPHVQAQTRQRVWTTLYLEARRRPGQNVRRSVLWTRAWIYNIDTRAILAQVARELAGELTREVGQ